MTYKRHEPPELHSFIELANSVAPDLELPEPRGRVPEIISFMKTAAFKGFRRLCGPIKPDTFLTKFLGPDAPKTYNSAMGKYVRLRDGRAWLRQAAEIGQTKWKMKYLLPTVSAYMDEKGLLVFNIDPLIKVLQGVEASRIRICPACALIFWAARRDQPCCSVRCAKIRRTRQWRESYEIKYREQRSDRKTFRRKSKEQAERDKLADLPAANSSIRKPRLARYKLVPKGEG